MNSFELDSGFEVLPSDDQYLSMKAAYKFGKFCYYFKDMNPIVPNKYSEEDREHFINGWLYQQWVVKNERIQRMSLLREQRES